MGQSKIKQIIGTVSSPWKRLLAPAGIAMGVLGFCFLVSLLAPPVAITASTKMIHAAFNLNTSGSRYGKTWGQNYTCNWPCHTTTATTNIKKVPSMVTTPIGPRPVKFTRVEAFNHTSTGVLGDDLRTYRTNSSTNICEVCHHQTLYHQYSTMMPDNVTPRYDLAHSWHQDFKTECLRCHDHAGGFARPNYQDCKVCHGNPPVARLDLFTGIMGTTELTAVYPALPTAPLDGGAHGRHRIDEGMLCNTCHNNSKHGLKGNDEMEFGFNINRTNWPSFSGSIVKGTMTISNNPGITFPNISAGSPNLGTTLLRSPALGATCSIYCHGDNWRYPSGKVGSQPVSWANGPLGDCSNASCHGTTRLNPPTPVMGNVSTGAHKRHVVKNNYDCTYCHDTYTLPHMVNGRTKTNMTNPIYGGYTAKYNGFRLQSSVSKVIQAGTFGNCTNVYCHSPAQSATGNKMTAADFKSVQWGGGFLGCNGCHGYPMTTGSHTKHTTGYADRFKCSDCHLGAGKDVETKHADGNIDVAFSASYGGSYTGTAKPGDGFGRCNTTYCHGEGVTPFSQITTATWGKTVSCKSCHKADAASGLPISTGKHTRHINRTDIPLSNFKCSECHANTVNATNVIINTANHVNMLKDYSGARAGKNRSACNTAYCHSDGKGAAGMTAGWSDSSTMPTNCRGCHGRAVLAAFTSVAGEPNYVNSGTGARTNSHDKHMGGLGNMTCVYCHSATVQADGTLVNGTKHVDGVVDIVNGGIKNGVPVTFSTTGSSFYPGTVKTCSNITCHGTGSAPATWGTQMPIDCTGCHGGNAGSASSINTNKHAAHINNLSGRLTNNFACGECHLPTVTVANDRLIANFATHGNTVVNYSGARAGRNKATCNTAYCHTNGKSVAGLAVAWDNSATPPLFVTCAGCHGALTPSYLNFTSKNGEPNYPNGVKGTATANSHKSHTRKIGGSVGAASCVICHDDTVTAAGNVIKPGSKHLDRSIDVKFNVGKEATAVWNGTARTCTNISCHFNTDATWGDPAAIGCKVCHANLSAMHSNHIGTLMSSGMVTFYNYTANKSDKVTGKYQFGCANCHPADDRLHQDGSVEINFAWNKLDRNGLQNNSYLNKLNKLVTTSTGGYTRTDATHFTCETVYCHSNGRDPMNPVLSDYKQTPNWYLGATFGANRCGSCHDNPPTYVGSSYTPVSRNSHYVANSNMGNNGVTANKDTGHMIGIHWKATAKGNNKNGFLGYSSSGSMAHGNKNVANTIACDYCHFGIVDPVQVDTYAMSHIPGNRFRCDNCHKATSRTPLQTGKIVDVSMHINGVKNIAVKPLNPFYTKAQLLNKNNANGWGRMSTYKADDAYDYANLSISSFTKDGNGIVTCVTACHVNQAGITWGGTLQCSSCHANQ